MTPSLLCLSNLSRHRRFGSERGCETIDAALNHSGTRRRIEYLGGQQRRGKRHLSRFDVSLRPELKRIVP